MRQVIASSLNRKTANQGRFLSYILLLQRLLRYSAVAFIVGMAALVFFPVSLTHATPILYIPHQETHTLSVIDASNYSLIKKISVDAQWGGIDISPDGKTVFVTTSDTSSLAAISTATNTVLNTVYIGNRPYGVAVSHDGGFAYVSVQQQGGQKDGYVSVIDTSAYSIVATVNVGKGPQGLAVHPDGSKLYVTNYSDKSVSVINTSSRKVIKTITVGGGPSGIAVHPSGTHVYVVNQFDHTVSVISTASNSVIKTVSVGQYPSKTAIDPLGQFVYVSNWGESTVSVVDTSSNSVVATISVGSGPGGISLDSTGLRAYVVNTSSDTISVIDTATHTVMVTASTDSQPIAFGNFVLDDSFYPTGVENYQYSATYFPVTNKDPAEAKPLGVGPIAYGMNKLKLMVEFDPFPAPVDIYLAFYAPAMGPDIWLITPGSVLQSISEGVVPWKSATTGPINEVLFGEIPMSDLPAVTYDLYVLVSPAGSLDNYYFWTTSFLGQYKIDNVVNAIMASFSGEQGFDAVVLAMDNGYSLRQIADAAMSGRLLANGDISDSSGGVEAPENPPYGLILDSTAQTGKARAIQFLTLEEMRAWAREVALSDPSYEEAILTRIMTTIVIGLTESGYSFPEAVLAVQTGGIVRSETTRDGGSRYILTDDEGLYIPPGGNEQGVFNDSEGMPCTDSDGDNYFAEYHCPNPYLRDCDDADPRRNRGMIEICGDGIDSNCDGSEEGCLALCEEPYPAGCGAGCMPSGHVCCPTGYCAPGESCCGTSCTPPGGMCCSNGGSCPAGDTCCGDGCMPAGSVCCSGLGYCPPGSTCNYETGGCSRSSAKISDLLNLDAKWQPAFEWTNNYGFISPAVRD